MEMTGAQIVVETLIEQGVDTVFGYPGGQVLNLYDELYKNSARLEHVITAHEQGASHAADGYARATGKVGVVIATSGPGATNLVTGLATAYLDSVPVVAITGNVPTELLGRDSFQEVDIAGIVMPVTKYSMIVKDVAQLAKKLREAFAIAKSGRPGPVLVDIPKDVQLALCEHSPQGPAAVRPLPPVAEETLELAAGLIRESSRPYIYCGGGVISAGAGETVARFAKLIDAPMGFSMMGLSAVPASNPMNLGMSGMHGRFASTKAMHEADLVIGIGVRFSDRAIGNRAQFGKNAKILHIDIDDAEIDKNVSSTVSLVGGIMPTLYALIGRLDKKNLSEWHDAIMEYKVHEYGEEVPEDSITPRRVVAEISTRADADTRIATDVGQHQMWTAQYYPFSTPRSFISSGGLGTMGFGLGAAIGACMAQGGKRTVLVTGDGSFHMNCAELCTAVSRNLPIVIVLMNNNVLGMVRQWQTIYFGKRYSNTTLDRKTDYIALSRAFGADGAVASDMESLRSALDKAFASDGPFLVDARIDSDERVLPMIPPNGTISQIILK